MSLAPFNEYVLAHGLEPVRKSCRDHTRFVHVALPEGQDDLADEVWDFYWANVPHRDNWSTVYRKGSERGRIFGFLREQENAAVLFKLRFGGQ